ncbi:Catabolite control protein A [Paenibacillus sp. CECT 9249]|nr:Catabolite control protein A [Paenibacillus sp. CECT 9249]
MKSTYRVIFGSIGARTMRVSIFDVAKKSGLSVVTVSRVLNNSSSVREKNRQKVLDAMRELNYHPNAAARSLAKGKTRIIGLIVTTLQDSFLDEVVNEVTNTLEAHGYYLALSVSPGLENEEHYLIQEDRVDGLIILSPIKEEQYVVELTKRKIPFVLIDNQKIIPSVFNVIVNNFQGGYDATRHLIELGHTKIAHIRGPEYFLSSVEREKGYRQALREAGLQPFAIEQGAFAMDDGYLIGRKWMEADRLPTAVFACDDNMAVGLINALMQEGIRVPDHVSVVGYDDQYFASALHPHLTTVKQPTVQIGRTAVDLLMKQINGNAIRSKTVKLEPKLIVRNSTAAPRM